MSKKSEEYLRGVPMKPYDLIREGLIMLAIVAAIIIVLAIVLKAPDAPTVRGEDVAKNQPIAFLKTCAISFPRRASCRTTVLRTLRTRTRPRRRSAWPRRTGSA